MRYFIELSYDGSRYHGWQIQPNGISVEGEIERCLSIILRHETNIVGAGRTDAGVHASQMFAHFDTEQNNDVSQLTYKINRLLPQDIAIHDISLVDDNMHARFSAKSRTYHYYLHTRKNPHKRLYSWYAHYSLDFRKMNEASQLLLEHKDFACFCKSHSDVKTTLCIITEAIWIQDSDYSWHFRITANRFLRNMVRAIVGTLIEVGRNRMTIDEFKDVLNSKKRTLAGESMPGNALFLEQIEY